MPNWIRNKLIVSNTFISELQKYHCKYDEFNNIYFDFNTVIKLPKELEIEISSKSYDGLKLYLAKINPSFKEYGEKKDKWIIDEYSSLIDKLKKTRCFFDNFLIDQNEIKAIITKYKDNINEVEELGRKMIQNYKDYQYMNWYDWCVDKWGTKWNSYNTKIGFNYLMFDTAWNPPIPLIIKLSKLHPNIKMALLYSNENIGYQTGFMLITNGTVDLEGTFKDESIDAYKLAFDLWDCGDSYRYDEGIGTYVPK